MVGTFQSLDFFMPECAWIFPCNNKCYNYITGMAYKTKIRKIGNSLGIVLPKEALQAMKVEEGATLYITEAPEGALQVTPEEKDFQDMMELAEKGMQKYRNALRELAK
jgi:putative addiction module antidote